MPIWDTVLDFWFQPSAQKLWFSKNPDFDAEIRARFEKAWSDAAAGLYDGWLAEPNGSLALILILDQFSRNLFRNDPRAFSSDARALTAANQTLAKGFDKTLPLDRRFFIYIPFEHSESLPDQDRSVALFEAWAASHEGEARSRAVDQLRYVHRHRDIIARFGRFPHRNEILGRPSTPEEIEFLKEPGSRF